MKETTEYLKRVNAALALREIPDYEAALVQLEKAAILSPDDASVHLLLGLTYQDLEELNKGEINFRKALQLQPDLLEAQQSLGLLLVQNRKYKDAITILRPLANADPANEAVVLSLAESYVRIENIEEAKNILYTTLALRPNTPSLLHPLAFLHFQSGELEEAIKYLDQAIKVKRLPEILNSRGVLSVVQKNLQEAICYFKEAVEIDPSNLSIIRNLAQAYLQAGDNDKALDTVDIGLNKFPNKAELLLVKAQVLEDKKQFSEAKKIFEEIDSNPKERRRFFFRYYISLLKSEQFDQALEEFNKESLCLSQDDRDSFLSFAENIGVNLFEQGNISLSKKLFQDILSIEQKRARSINNLGFILTSERNWASAEDLFNKANEEGYEHPSILKANQGYVALSQKQLKLAISYFKEFLEELESLGDEKTAILHVAFPWKDGLFISKEDDFPTRSILVQTSILVNLTTTYYLLNEADKAFTAISEAIQSDPDESNAYRVLGCLYFLNNDFINARKNWENALQSKISEGEAVVTQRWLETLEKISVEGC